MGNAELHAMYEEALGKVDGISFGQIRNIAKSLLLEHFDEDSRNTLWRDLNRGTVVINREELLWQYLYSYGNMHQQKMAMALERIPRLQRALADGYSVIDWGCGQGLATVCLLDHLRAMGIDSLPEQTILVEPSELAVENARLHVGLYGIDDARMVRKLLDDVREEDIETDSPVTIHLFSNILDVKGFDLKRLARLIGDGARGEHYFVCVSPINAGSGRLDAFKDYFVGTVDLASSSSSLNEASIIAHESFGRGQTGNFTVKLVVFKYVAGKSSVVQVEYYPPVQFFAAYQLDSVADGMRHEEERRSGIGLEVPPLSVFDVAAPFELGAHVYDDVHPLLAVLNNIVTRGLPTRCSPFVESAFEAYGESARPDELGSIRFEGRETDDALERFARAWTPIGVARVQKTILEAVICGKLDMGKDRWRVLARERDVPCAALAFEDLRQSMGHLSSLTRASAASTCQRSISRSLAPSHTRALRSTSMRTS